MAGAFRTCLKTVVGPAGSFKFSKDSLCSSTRTQSDSYFALCASSISATAGLVHQLMTDVEPANVPSFGGFDAFADAETDDNNSKDYVHIRIQQRNGKKSLTTVQGLEKGIDYKKVLKAFKKDFCCNGTVVEDTELGQVIQLQGDQRKNVSTFLVGNKICKKDQVKIHGF